MPSLNLPRYLTIVLSSTSYLLAEKRITSSLQSEEEGYKEALNYHSHFSTSTVKVPLLDMVCFEMYHLLVKSTFSS